MKQFEQIMGQARNGGVEIGRDQCDLLIDNPSVRKPSGVSGSKSVFTSIDATTTFVGGYRGGRFGLSVLLLRNTTNSTFLYVSSPYASEGDFTMNGLIEVFVDV